MADYMDVRFEREKQEAIDAGERALVSLQRAKQDLDSARSWGIWDMIGGGSFLSLIKHSKMDSANRHMEQAKSDLRNFSMELRDVNRSNDFRIETKDFLSVADWLCDNVLVDWMVQKRINQARSQVDEVIRRVEVILQQLRNL